MNTNQQPHLPPSQNNTNVFSKLMQRVVRSIFKAILWLLYRVKVHGLEHVYQAGDRVLIVPNHLSFLDALLIAVYIPEPLTFAIDTHVAQQWWIKYFLALTRANTHRIDPTNPLALRTLVASIKQGERVVIFPEGRITITNGLMKVYDGPALVAEKAGAMLLPVRLDGPQYTSWARLQGILRQRWFPKINIWFFPAQYLDLPSNLRGRSRRQHAGNRLYEILSQAMFQGNAVVHTLFQGLIDACKIHGAQHIAIEDITRKPWSYRKLLIAAFTFGQRMALDIQPGEKVGLMLPNVLSMVTSFFAIHAYGRIPALLNYSTGAANLIHACRVATIHTVYTARAFIETGKLEGLITALHSEGIHIIYLEDLRTKITILMRLYGVLAGLFPTLAYRYTCPKQQVDDPAVILFTSGTEGTPKGVVLSHNNLQTNRHQIAARIDFSPKDIVFNALPLFHSFGLSIGTLLPLLSGIRVFLYPSPLHYRMVPEMIYGTNATILFTTDTFLTGYARYAHPYDFYRLRLVFSGAERLKEQTRHIYNERFGVRIMEGYGVTETSPVLSINTPMHYQAGTVGRFLPGISWRLEPVPGIAEGGRLHVKGPNIMLGYLKNEAPGVLQPLHDGWHDTGDVAKVDANGYVTITGRLKRFAKVGGEMISLAAVENYVTRLWPGYIHAVVAMPDKRKGEQLVLVTDYAQAQRNELISFARREGLTELAMPKTILYQARLPILGTGKLDYVGINTLVMAHIAASLTQDSDDEDENL